MLTQEWIDPRDIDWTDSMNPLTGRGWGPDPGRNPFMAGVLSDPMWIALRTAHDLEPRIWVVPNPIDEVIQAGATYETSVNIDPNTWLYGVQAWMTSPGPPTNDFYVQITDAVTGGTVFSQQARGSNLAAAEGNTPLHNKLIYYLGSPRLFVPPSYPIVKIVNLSSSNVKCNFNLWCAVETRFLP